METDECETEVSMTSEHDAPNPVTDEVTGVKESGQNELPDAEKMETDETESNKVPAELQETPDKAETEQTTEEPVVLREIVKAVDSSNAAPEVAVQEEAVGGVEPVETKTGDEEVENLKKMKWEDIEAMSVDFVANNIHHPVVSCYRELTKSDVHQILSQVRFKSDGNELEKAVMCITLMDYVATALNNPLYSEHFSRNQCSIRPCVKVIFTETRRVLKNWVSSNPSTFLSGKRMVLKYLHSLSTYFKEIQYEKPYIAAVNCLERDAARAHREASKSKQSKKPKPVLHEVAQNTPDEEEMGEIADGSFFDFLDDIPTKPKPIASPLVSNKTPNSKRKEKAGSNIRNFFFQSQKSSNTTPKTDTASTPSLKRPATTELDQNSNKKACLTTKEAVPTPIPIIPKNQETDSSKSTESSSSKYFNGANETPKVKEKVNAFALLMNRSKELAKASKAKKLAASAQVTTTPRAVYTVE